MDKEVFAMKMLAGLGALIFLALGLVGWFTDDMAGMFCCYKDGGIYWSKEGTLIAEDTPKNRRRLSRIFGTIWLLAGAAALLAAFFR